MKDENESASNASFFVDEPVAAPEKKKEERKVTVPTVSNQGVAPNTDLLTEAKNAVAAPIAPVQVAQQAASANAAMPNPVTSSMKNVTGGINDFLSTTTLKDVAPYLLGAGGYALGKHLLNLRGEAGQAVTPPQTTPTQPAPTQAATAQPAAPQTPVNQQPPTTQPPVANTQQAPQSIVFDQPPEIPSDERLVEKHMEAVKEELGKKEVPAGNPKVTAGEVGSLVESEKNAAANQQATLHKQTQSNRQPFEGVNVVKTGTGKDAYVGQSDASKFKKSYGHASEIPKDWAFVPGAQYSDLMRNNIAAYQQTKTEPI